ncbi:MAG: hypothetical protein HY396_01340 [Candidatus Doudnabacteria bacterium]|nr:hypothetical protein [Candidatus Doudnabacteria bacterium]
MKYFVYATIIIVAATVVAGFFIVGSPQEARLRGFDERKIQDLEFIQAEIVNYWQNKNVLPQNLAELNDDIRGIRIPKDPQTGADYGYKIQESLSFALCASFNRPSYQKDISGPLSSRVYKTSYPASEPYFISQNWDHDAGEVCFERTIDKDLYRKQNTPSD